MGTMAGGLLGRVTDKSNAMLYSIRKGETG